MKIQHKISARFQPGGIGRHISWLLLHSGVEAVSMTVAAMFAARWFGPIAWGQLGILLAGVQFISMFADGFYSTIVKTISEGKSLGNDDTALLGWKLITVTGCILLLASVGVGILAGTILSAQTAFLWIILSVLLATGRGWRAVLDGGFRGFQEFQGPAIAGMVCSVLMAGTIIGLTSCGYRITSYLGVMLLGSIINCTWLAIIFRRKFLSPLAKTNIETESVKKFLNYSVPLASRGVCGFLFLKINVWMLGWMATDFDAGQFRLTDQFLTIPSLILSATLAAVAPRITQAQLSGDFELSRLMARVYGLMLWLTLPIALFFLLNGPLLNWIFPQYGPASQMLTFFAPAMIIQGVAFASSVLLIQGGQPGTAFLLTLIPSLFNIVCAYIGFKAYGVMGLAASTATVHLFTYLITVGMTHRLFRMPLKIKLF